VIRETVLRRDFEALDGNKTQDQEVWIEVKPRAHSWKLAGVMTLLPASETVEEAHVARPQAVGSLNETLGGSPLERLSSQI
jgi:hypothetical protein